MVVETKQTITIWRLTKFLRLLFIFSRYLHRKPDSFETDYVPLQVNIWKKLPNGDREFVTREARYLRVNIAGARKLEPPVIRIFRQVSDRYLSLTWCDFDDCVITAPFHSPSKGEFDPHRWQFFRSAERLHSCSESGLRRPIRGKCNQSSGSTLRPACQFARSHTARIELPHRRATQRPHCPPAP